jgi:membrane fusion protein, multidrug efflux system
MRRLPAVLLVAVTAGCRHPAPPEEEQAPVEVHCVAPKPDAIDVTVALRGRIEPPPGGDLPIASQVQGRVTQVVVHEGQHIQRGDLVARVDESMSRDAVRQADAARVQAIAQEANAQLTLDRTRALVDRGIAAKQELEDAIAREEAAKASVASASAALDVAQRTLGRVAVKSTLDGVVTKVWRGPGALVDGTGATPIVELATAGGVEFVADATERELTDIHEGEAVKGTLIDDHDFEGVVRARASALDPATGLGTVRVTIPSGAESIPIGAFGRVVITLAHRDQVPLLPSSALRGAVADGAEVVVCKDGKAELRPVKVGWRDEERFEPVGGLAPDERVATDHVLGLENDAPIAEAK